MRALVEAPWVPSKWLAERAGGADLEAAWRAKKIRDEAGFRHAHMLRAAVAVANHGQVRVPVAQYVAPLVDAASEPGLLEFLARLGRGGERFGDDAEGVYERASLADSLLVATGSRGLVLELSTAGDERWRVPFAAWSAECRTVERFLLASLDERRVVEIDREGRLRWEYRDVAALRAKPLLNSHVLIVDHGGKQALEVNRAGTVVWRYATDEPCLDAERLANGHTLVATANQIIEVTPTGDVVWRWNVQGRVNGIQALPGGRLLVANFGASEVVELDDGGAVLKRIAESGPSDAFRLRDGSTLVATAQRVVEFAPDGTLRRVLTTARYGSARR